MVILLTIGIISHGNAHDACKPCSKIINKYCCERSREIYENQPQKKICCDFSKNAKSSFVQRKEPSGSEDLNYGKCSKTEELFSSDNVLINASIANGRNFEDHLKLSSINYCEIKGNFIFYSSENYKGSFKYIGGNDYNMWKRHLSEMEPSVSFLDKVNSVRKVGHPGVFHADTVTFFKNKLFQGDQLEMIDDGRTEQKLSFNPGSAVITGRESSEWTIFDSNGDCFRLIPENSGDAIPAFIPDLDEARRNDAPIERIIKGDHCQ